MTTREVAGQVNLGIPPSPRSPPFPPKPLSRASGSAIIIRKSPPTGPPPNNPLILPQSSPYHKYIILSIRNLNLTHILLRRCVLPQHIILVNDEIPRGHEPHQMPVYQDGSCPVGVVGYSVHGQRRGIGEGVNDDFVFFRRRVDFVDDAPVEGPWIVLGGGRALLAGGVLKWEEPWRKKWTGV